MQHPSDMSPSDLRCLRLYHLGLTPTQLARALGINRETVRRWETEADLYPISAAHAEALHQLIMYTRDVENALAAAHRRGSTIPTYATDDELHAAEPGLWHSLPASWHQAAAWRAAQRLGGGTDYAVPRTDDGTA